MKIEVNTGETLVIKIGEQEIQLTVRDNENTEVGELASAVAKDNEDATVDAIGDVLVTIIILSAQLELSPWYCLESAYEEIRNRKGKTVDGVFIKE